MDEQKKSATKKLFANAFHHKLQRDIVVVGASAGGVEALEELVAGLPPNFPAAILVVLHIPAYAPSQLHAILDRAGPLRAALAVDGEPICGGRIYCVPADHHLVVEGNNLRLTRGPKEGRVRPSVDVLFRSAAYSAGARVIGVLLTGALDDGTAGLWAIKDRGGLALVQSPEEALYPSMPESALDHVEVDAVRPVAEMPMLLVEWTSEVIEVEGEMQESEKMKREVEIALEDDALEKGVVELGPATPYTCPECHGVLFQIQEGSITRYRCHTGHAYSRESLLAETQEEMDDTLWSTIRTFEERILLLRDMEKSARERKDEEEAEQCAQRIKHSEKRVAQLREIVLQSDA